MQTMERNLQDDITSLTMKNSILRQLLEVISEHEGDDKTFGSKESHKQSTQQKRSNLCNSNDSPTQLATSDLGSDSVIAKHINRLPHDIQVRVQ